MRTLKLFKNLLRKNFIFNNKRFFSLGETKKIEEINIRSNTTEQFFPIRGFPEFKDGLFTVFENKSIGTKVPYEIKEYTMKGFLYTFFLIFGGKMMGAYTEAKVITASMAYSFIPASVFAFFYGKIVWTMLNSVSSIKLKENGTHVIFEFKNFLPPLEVEISRLEKIKSENFFNECYFEPFLYPIKIDYNDFYGKFSFLNKRKLYIYGDSHESIKHGEIFRAILNGQSIKLK